MLPPNLPWTILRYLQYVDNMIPRSTPRFGEPEEVGEQFPDSGELRGVGNLTGQSMPNFGIHLLSCAKASDSYNPF